MNIGELKEILAQNDYPDDTPVVVDNCQGIVDNATFYGGELNSLDGGYEGGSVEEDTGTKYFAIYTD